MVIRSLSWWMSGSHCKEHQSLETNPLVVEDRYLGMKVLECVSPFIYLYVEIYIYVSPDGTVKSSSDLYENERHSYHERKEKFLFQSKTRTL